MVCDVETCELAEAFAQGLHEAVVELGHRAAAGAEDVVVVPAGVAAIGQAVGAQLVPVGAVPEVEPHHDTGGSEHLKSSVNRNQTGVWLARRDYGMYLSGGEVLVLLKENVEYRPALRRKAMASCAQARLGAGEVVCMDEDTGVVHCRGYTCLAAAGHDGVNEKRRQRCAAGAG